MAFKKPRDVAVANAAQLKKKEVKALKAKAMTQARYDDADKLDELLPDKGAVEAVKLGNRAQVWRVKDQPPLLFDVGGRGDDALPTVYMLWQFPDALPCLWIFSPVSEFVLRGADLMLPGVVLTEDGLTHRKGDWLCVRVIGNPCPIAVGRATCSGEDAMASGMNGKGLEVLHRFGDALWEMGGKAKPNDGFTLKRVNPVAGIVEEMDVFVGDDEGGDTGAGAGAGAVDDEAKGDEVVPEDWEADADGGADGGDASAAAGDAAAAAAATARAGGEDWGGASASEVEGSGVAADGASEGGAVAAAGAGAAEAGAAEAGGAGDAHGDGDGDAGADAGASDDEADDEYARFRAMKPDELFVATFLQALHRSEDKDFPMAAEAFVETRMMAARPRGTTIDLKATSFKKMAKFMQQMKKRKIIKTDDKGGTLSIASVLRLHSHEYKKHEPWDPRMEHGQDRVRAGAGAGGGGAASGRGGGDGGGGGRVAPPAPPANAPVVSDLLRPTGDVVAVFEAVLSDPECRVEGVEGIIVETSKRRAGHGSGSAVGPAGRLYRADEVRKVVTEYVRLKSLTDARNAQGVVLDPTLCEALFKGSLKKGERYPTTASKKAVAQQFLKRCAAWHMIKRGDEVTYGKGSAKPIEVETKMVRGHKGTFVRYQEVYGITAKEVAQLAKLVFQTSTTTQPNPHKPSAEEVFIMGGHGQKMSEQLVVTYGLPPHCIKLVERIPAKGGRR